MDTGIFPLFAHMGGIKFIMIPIKVNPNHFCLILNIKAIITNKNVIPRIILKYSIINWDTFP